jgi:dTDP-4-dehydrorhamnose reductase
MKNVLVIGCKGMAGHIIFDLLPTLGDYNIYGIARNIQEEPNLFNLDVHDLAKLNQIITENNIDYVVNVIGLLNHFAEQNPDEAIWINSYFPNYLAKITKDTKTKIINISTDCVFSGKRGNYSEEDFRDGNDMYSRSKSLGEINNSKDVTIRTSIVGPEIDKGGIGLFNWFMKQDSSLSLEGYSNVFWSGITTLELAKVIDAVIKQNVTGLINVTSQSKISKYQLLQLFNKIFKNDGVSIHKKEDYFVDKSLVSIRTDFAYTVPNYEDMLKDMKKWLLKNNSKYALIYATVFQFMFTICFNLFIRNF